MFHISSLSYRESDIKRDRRRRVSWASQCTQTSVAGISFLMSWYIATGRDHVGLFPSRRPQNDWWVQNARPTGAARDRANAPQSIDLPMYSLFASFFFECSLSRPSWVYAKKVLANTKARLVSPRWHAKRNKRATLRRQEEHAAAVARFPRYNHSSHPLPADMKS